MTIEALGLRLLPLNYDFVETRPFPFIPLLAKGVAVFLAEAAKRPSARPTVFRHFGFSRGILRRGIYLGIRLFSAEFPRNLTVFIRTAIFLTENDLKVALFQVCL